MEDVLLPVRLVRDARVVIEATDDLHLIRLEARLHPEGASRPTLAGEAVQMETAHGSPVTSRRSWPQWQAASRVAIAA
jgi:hypothetical protein